MPEVGELIDAAVAGGGVPGAVACLGRHSATLATCVAGRADATPGAERAMTADTVFDLASLTKAVATTTVTLALIGAGRLTLDTAVARCLPEARWPGAVTVRHLLTHTAGLPDSVKFYQWCDTREQVLHELYRTPLAAPPGTAVVYSDLGFMALGEVVAAVAGEPFGAAVRRLVTGPLRMDATGFNPSGPAQRFAATERRDDGVPWTGVVHDENARAMGGVAGHAGLFSTVADLARFTRWWVSPEDGPVPVPLRRAATACQTAGLSGCRGLGWVRQGDRFDILGGTWPMTSVSHTGFTGTSLALDPASGLWLVLLTNAVHFGRDATAVRSLRRAVHAAAIESRLRSGGRGMDGRRVESGVASVDRMAETRTRPGGWRRAGLSKRGRFVAAGVALVLAAGGVTGGILAANWGPAVPSLYMSGIAEKPCAPGQAVAVPAGQASRFLPGTSVLSTDAQSPCAAAAIAASQRWLDTGTIPGADAMRRQLATRALLDLRLSVLPDGAVAAGFHHGWNYAWPRDSSWVVVALADTGHSADALNVLRFLQRMQRRDGTWEARYHLDGSGPVRDGRPAELDAVGWVPWAVWSWAATQRLTPGSPASTGLTGLWPMVTRAADAAANSITSNGLPKPVMDYWEDQPIGQTLDNTAPLLAGLRSAADLAATEAAAGVAGARGAEARWTSAAARLSAAITRTFGRTGYQRTPDSGAGADAAVTYLGPPFAAPSAAVTAAVAAAQRALTEPNGGLRPGTAWRGAAGVAWTPETAMFALFDASTGQQAAASNLVDWLAAHRTTLGELPEQVAPDGKPVSVAPLAWTDAIVLLTLLAQDHHLPPGP